MANRADYLYDDAGVRGSLSTDANFVILGDYNSDPLDGDSYPGAIDQLLDSPRVVDTLPSSLGGAQESEIQGGANLTHKTDPKYDTGDFGDVPRPGNLRIDYVLPNVGTQVDEARVFWPTREEETFRLTGLYPFPTSDHRRVWTRLRFPIAPAPSASPSPRQDTASPSASGEESRLANSGTHADLVLGVGLASGASGASRGSRHEVTAAAPESHAPRSVAEGQPAPQHSHVECHTSHSSPCSLLRRSG